MTVIFIFYYKNEDIKVNEFPIEDDFYKGIRKKFVPSYVCSIVFKDGHITTLPKLEPKKSSTPLAKLDSEPTTTTKV